MNYIVNQVPLNTAAMSALPFDSGLEARYSFITAYGDEVHMARREGHTLWVPRKTCPWAEPQNDYRVRYTPSAIDCNFVPRSDEQRDLCEKSIELLLSGQDHVFDAPTGWGKTIAGSYIAARVGQPTLIIVQKEDLVEQWREALIDVLGIDPSLVGYIQQDTCDFVGKAFVIGMLQSLILPERYPPEMYKYFGMVVFDEVHLVAADTFSRACEIFPAYHRLGFSATTLRRDGKSRVIEAHIGPVLVKGTLVPMKAKVLVKRTGWRIPKEAKYEPGKMMAVFKAMGKDFVRNAEITEFVWQAFNADRTILVMSDLIEGHLIRLFHTFTSKGIPGEDIGYYIGGMSKIDLEATKQRRVVLGTYQMCSTGTNVPHWDTLVMATPRAHVKQPVGRVLRTMLGKKQPVILDLVDGDAIFHGYHLSRMKDYYSIGAELVQVA